MVSPLTVYSLVESWLHNMGPEGRKFVKNIIFVLCELLGDKRRTNMAMELLCRCKGLRSLTIELPYDMIGHRNFPNILVMAGVKKLREIRGCMEVHVIQEQPTDTTPSQDEQQDLQ